MSLELAERMRGIDVDQAWEEIRTARETTSDALAEMRMWVRALNPVRDAQARGLAALELIAESFRGTGLTVDVSGDEASDRELASDDEVALLIYRAVQEGITNALRHGRARTVRIFLAVKEQQMELAVINDFGRGAAAEPPESVPDFGFGLRGIFDRTVERGGSMHARRVDGEFHLDVVVPLHGSGGTDREETRQRD